PARHAGRHRERRHRHAAGAGVLPPAEDDRRHRQSDGRARTRPVRHRRQDRETLALMTRKQKLFAIALGLVALGTAAAHAQAERYPARPIRIVVPFAAGGAVDTLARLVGGKLGESIGQPVIIENRAGAGGNLAAEIVAKAAADGYTILLTTNGLAIAPSLYNKLPFDAAQDFRPVTQVVASALVLVASPKSELETVQEFVAAAKARPGGLNYGSTGIANPLHL